MNANAIRQPVIPPAAPLNNTQPIGGSHPHLVIEGRTQPPSAQQEANRAFIAAVRGFGEAMRSAAAAALSNTQNLFDTMIGTSSHGDAMTVVANGYENGNGYANGYENGNGNGNGYEAYVRVHQLASTQQNNGPSMPAGERNGASPGRNNFSIERNGRAFNFSVNISETASNRSVQQRVANAINDQPTSGVRAHVQSDEGGQSSLVLTAVNSGERNAFTIADAPDEGNAVEAVGVGNITREAQDALYTVNGEERAAPTNTVDLTEGIRATLQRPGPEEITAATERDVEGITDAIGELVAHFNVMRQAAVEYSDQDSGAEALRRRLDNIYYDNEPALESVGVTRGDDGRLQVDDGELAASVENGTAQEQLTDGFGFTGQMSRLGEVLNNDPVNFEMQLSMATL
ncbi:MAG: flagellar filament capping protein FliD [Defluviitaleaceae bacterium]|nr:flagellar filament capping protein FliD [Defluviitaleaceae bacterium]MCL2239411.1 flagellar filament capping protein FliD [Defluviitaleaceae bacterium]